MPDYRVSDWRSAKSITRSILGDSDSTVALFRGGKFSAAEITTAYKRLQTLKTTLDRIALDAFPTLNGVQDAEAFERELGNLRAKAELEGAERAKLASQLQREWRA